MKLITIICPIYNEESFIYSTLKNLNNSLKNFDKTKIDILFIDGGSTDTTREKLNSYKKVFTKLNYIIINNPHKFVSHAMNIGIEKSNSEYIARIDSHSILPENYFKILLEYSKKLNSENIGFAVDTIPPDNSLISKSISIALSSKFGVGNSHFRTSNVNKPLSVDTVPYGFFPKKVFTKIGLYDTNLLRNQDDELNYRIISNGGKIYLLPGLRVKYFSRNSFLKLFQMYFQYGLFKPLVIYKTGIFRLRQLAPLFLILGIIFDILIYLFTGFPMIIVLTYISFIFISSFFLGIKNHKLILIPLIVTSLVLVHISYGIGFLNGSIGLIFKKQIKNVKSSR